MRFELKEISLTDEVALSNQVTGVANATPFFIGGIMHPFDKAVNAVKEMVSKGDIDSSEYIRLGLSDYRWTVFRKRNLVNFKIHKGSVYQFDFGKNPVPEMSYEHRGLVIGKNKSILYVLPISTYRKSSHDADLYDPSSAKGQRGNLYLIKASDHSFIKHDSVLKLDDLRCVSTKRILYRQHDGKIPTSSDEYKEIEILAFSRLFPQFHYELMNYREQSKKKESN